MRRRAFISLLGGAAAAWPLAARAQQLDRMRRVGLLMPSSDTDPETQHRLNVFRQALAALGWTEGRNVRFDYRWAIGETARIAAAKTAALVRQVLGAISQFEKTSLVAKLKAARDRKRAASGKCEGRKSLVEIDPAAVATAKQLHRRGQRSLREIAAELAKLGYVNRRGNVYSASAIASMLGGAK